MTRSDTPRPHSGEIVAYAFADRATAPSRRLCWVINIPIVGVERVDHAAIHIEWARFDVRDWRDLVGHHVRADGLTEVSFYVGDDRHGADELTLTFLSRDGTSFRVAVDVEATLDALDGRVVRVRGETTLRLWCVAVIRDDARLEPWTTADAQRVVEPYVDVSAFAGWRRNERGDFLLVSEESMLVEEGDG